MSERKQKPETRLVASIIEAVNLLPRCWARRINSGGYRGRMRGCEAGSPDIEVFLPASRVLHIEAKGTKATKLSAEQIEWHARAAALGHVVVVCRDVPSAVKAVLLAKHAGGAHG